jgi:uncharacterized protein DUF5753/helix-turn-helix protein
MAIGVQTVPRVLLGEALKQLRSDAGVTLDVAAKVVGKDRPRLVKVLDGVATLSTEELEALVDFLGAEEPLRAEILALGIQARKRATPSPYMDLAPGSFRRLAWLEAIATDIWDYQKGIYPLPIQSPEYGEAVLGAAEGIWWDETGNVKANLLAFRRERQKQIFDADPPKRIEILFTDDALFAEVGGPDVTRNQIAHVLDLIGRWSNLTVRVVPMTARDNPAQFGNLKMLRFGDVLRPIGFLPVVYGPSVYLDKTEDTERILRAFNRLRDLALSPAKTRALLETRLKENPGEGKRLVQE